jgi:multidrug efflux pump subunit AcrA (membrane-fusion protein)
VNREMLLKPGMFATAAIQQPEGQSAVFVPAPAVLADPNTDSYRVYVLQGNTARLRVVQVRMQQDIQVSILSGVNAGERVITSNLDQLFDGAPVQVR